MAVVDDDEPLHSAGYSKVFRRADTAAGLPVHRAIRHAAGALTAIAVAVTVITAPNTSADPAIPTNCEVTDTLYCDQPIDADGSWIRCLTTTPIVLSRGRVIPSVRQCGRVTADAIPAGPPYHIGD